VPTARSQRNANSNAAAAHRAIGPQWEATNLGVMENPGLAKTSVDVLTVPGKEDNETTAIRQFSELAAIRPSRVAVTEPNDVPQGIVLAPGGRVSKYELREKLGMGTFGLVFTARDTELERDVALKVLNPAHITNRDVLLRFLQEARASARISHPGIVTVFDCGRIPTTFGETAFITMELLAGESVTSRINRSGRLAPEAACEIARQVASALDAAHRADVLHRDLKPDNIYLVPDPAVPSGERVKVIDFGLAKLGRHGHTMMNTVFGTPRYMSPEQCRSSGEIDQRSDIYSLGCILFELVTGRTPFDGDLRQLIERHQRATPPRAKSFAPEISDGLDDLIDCMLAKDPAARPQTMGAVQRALEALGAVSVGVAATMLPMPAHLIGLAPQPQPPPVAVPGSGPRVFVASEAEILVPALPPPRPRNPNLMLPPEGRRSRKRTVLVASAVAFVVAALLTAIATHEPAIAGNAPPQRPAAARTAGS
jgi:serine/threonine protein kinase